MLEVKKQTRENTSYLLGAPIEVSLGGLGVPHAGTDLVPLGEASASPVVREVVPAGVCTGKRAHDTDTLL